MEISKKEFDILWGIKEGMKWMSELEIFSGFDSSTVKDILFKLEKLKIIKLEKKIDEYYNDENWIAKLIKKNSDIIFEEYKDWIPNKELDKIDWRLFSVTTEM